MRSSSSSVSSRIRNATRVRHRRTTNPCPASSRCSRTDNADHHHKGKSLAKRASKRGIHSQPNHGHSIDWLTPPDLLERLGTFDLDPCASNLQASHDLANYPVYAERLICPPDNGLTAEWGSNERVWLNPPYGLKNSQLWMQRMAEHSYGTALVAVRTEVEAWWVPYVWNAATAVLFLHGRLHYHHPEDGRRAKGNAGHGSALVAYGRFDAGILLMCGLAGEFVWLDRAKRKTNDANVEGLAS